MVFFNDPLPCAGRARARGADGRRDARARRRARRAAGAGAATTSASASASRRATPRSAASASRAARTTRRSAPSRTWRRASAPRPVPGRSSSASGSTRPPRTIAVAEPVGELELRGFSRPARAYNIIGSRRGEGRGMTAATNGAAAAERSERGGARRALRRAAGAAARRLAGDAARPAGRVDRRRAVGRARAPDSSGAAVQALEERFLFLLLLLRQPRLRVIYLTGPSRAGERRRATTSRCCPA